MKKIILLLSFALNAHANSARIMEIQSQSFSFNKPTASFSRHIAFSDGNVFSDEVSRYAPFDHDKAKNYDSYCVVSSRLSYDSWKEISGPFTIPSVSFETLIGPQGQGSQPPTYIEYDEKEFKTRFTFRVSNEVIAQIGPDGDNLRYFFNDVFCAKTVAKENYATELAAGKLNDDEILKRAFGSFLRDLP